MPHGRWVNGLRLIGLCLLVGVALLGCAKQPELGTAGPAGMGPSAVTAPAGPGSPATGAPGSSGGEIAVTRPTLPTETPIESRPSLSSPAAGTVSGAGAQAASALQDVFFDYDSSAIRGDQQSVLAADVAWLQANPGVRLSLEGHCDERGTPEFNLALGDRRAKAVRAYLVAAGVGADRITTISYGEERPFVPGHDESAWRWNRRVHFVVAVP